MRYTWGFMFVLLALPSFASAALVCPTLSFGSTGSSVTALQTFLHSAYADFPAPTGYFGKTTQAAVKQWQGEHGIEKLGFVGPKTRVAMGLSCNSNITSTVTKPTTPSASTSALIQALLAQIKILQDKIAAMKGGSVGTTPPFTTTVPSGGGGGLVGGSGSTNGGGGTTCIREPSQTQTLSCPSGQTGSITQTRTSTCPGPVWSEWATTGNTCATMATGPIILSGSFDPVVWMNTTKGAGNAKLFGELWDEAKKTWVPNGGPANPMRMSADLANNHVYFHKDSSWQDFVGQTYTFDSSHVRNRTETVANFDCTYANPPGGRCDTPGSWDMRNDKFRLFVDQADPKHGYILAPRPAQNGWTSALNTFDTYYCSTFSELHTNTCTLYQKGVQMYVTVNFYSNYDIFNAEGDLVSVTPSGNPQNRIYDVMVITIEDGSCDLNATPGTARCSGRERNFYGRIGNDYWSFVRFDDALKENGQYKLRTRAVTYAWDTSYNPSFNDLKARALEDDSAAFTPSAPSVPYNLKATCSQDGTHATFSWSGAAGATSYWLRADDTTNQAAGCSAPTITSAGSLCVSPTDYVNNDVTNPITVTVPLNKQISWWVHAIKPSGPGTAVISMTFSCPTQ